MEESAPRKKHWLEGDKSAGFCTNRHSIDWWKTGHDDPGSTSEGFDTPEEFYKEES